MVVDLWESEDDFRRIFDAAEFKRNVAASNWPGRPEVEVSGTRHHPVTREARVVPHESARTVLRQRRPV